MLLIQNILISNFIDFVHHVATIHKNAGYLSSNYSFKAIFFCKKVFIFSKFYMLHYNIAVYLSSPPRSDWEDIQGNMSSSRRN